MTQEQRLVALAQALGADVKDLLATRGTLSALDTAAQASLVAAINEVLGVAEAAAGGGVTLAQVQAEVASGIAGVVAGAPAAFDTLSEIATELADQDSVAAGLVTAVANRVRYDAAQALDATQQTTARSNIDAQSSAAIGDPDRDLVAAYTAAKA